MKTLRKNKKRISGKKHNSRLINKRRTRMRGGATSIVPQRLSLPIKSTFNFSYVGVGEDDKIDKIFEFDINKFNNKEKLTDITGMVIDVYIPDTNPVNADKSKKYFKFIYKKLGNDGIRKIIYVYPKYQEVSTLFPSDDKENQNIFIVHEFTNQAITVETDPNLEKGLSITPLELSVDTMQLAINTGCLQVTKDVTRDGENSYLGFVSNDKYKFPSLVFKEKLFYGYKSSRNDAIWTNVYEDDTTFKIDETYTSPDVHVNYQDKSQPRINTDILFENESYFMNMKKQIQMVIEQIQIVKNLMKKEKEKSSQYSRTTSSNIKLNFRPNKPRSDTKTPITNSETLRLIESFNSLNDELYIEFSKDIKNNESYFMPRKTDITKLLKESNYDELIQFLNLELDRLYNRCIYGKNVKIENGIGDSHTIIENIGWFMQNSLWLERYLEIKNAKLREEYEKTRVLQGRSNKNNNPTINTLNIKLRYAEQSNNLIEQKDLRKQIEQISISIDKNFNEWKKNINLYDEKYYIGLPNLEPLNNEHYKCDLSGLDEKYIIVDEFVNPSDGETYVICGYPDEKMKQIVLNFWQDENMKTELNKIYLEQETTNPKMFIDLFNEYKKLDLNSQGPYTEGDLYMNLKKGLFNDIETIYNSLYKDKQELYKDDSHYKTYIKMFKNTDGKENKFRKNAKLYFQKIGEKYLHKPITHINYRFLVFKKNKDNKFLIPFIFNVKNLTIAHKSILIEIEKKIKNKLSYRFGILKHDEIKKYPLFDDDYKLWYSRYNYGKFFHIRTQYIHSMSNITDKSNNYINSITLEELIYNCGLTYNPFTNSNSNTTSNKINFFDKLKISYKIREYQFYDKKNILENFEKFEKDNKNNKNKDCLTIHNYNRSDIVFCLFKKEKLRREYKDIQLGGSSNYIMLNNILNNQNYKNWKEIKNTKEKEKKKLNQDKQYIQNYINKKTFTDIFLSNEKYKIKFILMFKTEQQEYTFIYSYNNKFYKLIIISNISKLIEEIINELKKLYNNFNNIQIKFEKNIKIFKIISIDNLDDIKEYYKYIFQYPINIIDVKKIPDILDISYFYETSLLNAKKILQNNNINNNIKNLFKEVKPYIYTNNIKGIQYIEGLKKYHKSKNNIDCNNITYEDKFPDCSIKECSSENALINCAFYNLENCGYDFIEFINPSYNKKLIVFVVPHNYNYNEDFIINPIYKTKYLGNFLDLDNTSLNMLKQIKNKYSNINNLCFLHHAYQYKNYLLHFHVTSQHDYKRLYPKIINSHFVIQDIYIDKIINNIESNKKYFNLIDYTLIK